MKKGILAIVFVLIMATASMAGAKLTEDQLLEQIKGQWYSYGVVYNLDLKNGLYEMGGDKFPMTIEGYDLPRYKVAIAVTGEVKTMHYILSLKQRDNFAGTGILVQQIKGSRTGDRLDYVGPIQ